MPNLFSSKAKLAHKFFVLCSVFIGFSLLSTPAKAGFQWVSPTEPMPAPAYAQQPATPPNSQAVPPLMPAPTAPVIQVPATSSVPSSTPEVISPIVIEGSAATPSSPSPPPVSDRTQSLGTLPVSSPDAIVQGFANNVPLAVALREVLPPGYGYSIDQDVDLGTLVSFQGGKPWRETLQIMLQPADLVMREQNGMVAIGRSSGASNAPMPESSAMIPPTATAAAPAAGLPLATTYAMPSTPTSVWPAMAMNGPKPLIAQPNVSLPSAPPSPPPVSSSRLSSTSIVDTWTASRGDTLHKVLEAWSRRAGTEFEWDVEYDYPLQASISYTGTFEEAVRNLLSGFEDAHPQPVAELHANPGAGQMVLVVQARGNSYTD